MASIESLRLDVEELQKLEEQAKRKKVKDILSIEIRKLQTEISAKQEKLQKDEAASAKTPEGNEPSSISSRPKVNPTIQITTYGWDQSEKFMKIYITLNGIQQIPKENITSKFSDRGLELSVSDFKDKNHQLVISRLFEDIVPGDSYHKVKTDMILVMLKKKTQGKTWTYVTQRDEKKKMKEPAKKPPTGDDPSDGLMNLLQNMYEDGDDEMKRSIQKAWHDSRNKNPGAGMEM